MYHILIIKHSKNAENKRIKITQKPQPNGHPAYIYFVQSYEYIIFVQRVVYKCAAFK